jgi:adenylate kinase
VFAEETEPVIDRYSDHEAFVDIDGDQPPEDVWADIEAAITERIEG